MRIIFFIILIYSCSPAYAFLYTEMTSNNVTYYDSFNHGKFNLYGYRISSKHIFTEAAGGEWISNKYRYLDATGNIDSDKILKSSIGLFLIGFKQELLPSVVIELGLGCYSEKFRIIESKLEAVNTSFPYASSLFVAWQPIERIQLKSGLVYFSKGHQKREQQIIPARYFLTTSIEIMFWKD